MVDIQSVAAEIRPGKKKKDRRKKPHGKNIMACLLHREAITSRKRRTLEEKPEHISMCQLPKQTSKVKALNET